jgi:hypothetical protein
MRPDHTTPDLTDEPADLAATLAALDAAERDMPEGGPVGASDLQQRLRDMCIDWDGEPIADTSTPRSEPDCRILREAAERIDALKREAAANSAELDECLAHKEQLHAEVERLRGLLAKIDGQVSHAYLGDWSIALAEIRKLAFAASAIEAGKHLPASGGEG